MTGAHSNGGMPIKCGCREHRARAFSRKEAKEFAKALSGKLALLPPARKCRHFSHFDEAIARLETISSEDATNLILVCLGECASNGFRGVRPQLSMMLAVLARLARRDGYSLRVVAETALLKL